MGLLRHDENLREHPDDWAEYLNHGIWHHWHEAYREALSDYDRSIEIAPAIAYAFCSRASLRATCPDPAFRDGPKALEDARTAMRVARLAGELIGDWRERLYLQVLAASHAECGDFQEAIAVQSMALDVASTLRAKSEIFPRLEGYQSGHPIRDAMGLVRVGFSRSALGAPSPKPQ
jgi:tetratricopeptide (TPR) repeat protein